ncbi:hypothetical protein DENIS_2546 [Desulfonema ishimotonii]|uniref:Uncharacterized protein n=1 Tax=Desulfonema ishimotonii TaxID=45657 RepID=A0A401FXC2_9BACT|nr:hypothetical protein DENIS_2546 [Desulfonema ishimotonii]
MGNARLEAVGRGNALLTEVTGRTLTVAGYKVSTYPKVPDFFSVIPNECEESQELTLRPE